MKRNIITTILACVVAMTLAVEAQAQQQGAATPKSATNYREVPARLIPAPSDASPELQAVIARPLSPALRFVPKTVEEWRRIVAMKTEQNAPVFKQLINMFPVDIKSETKGGVKTYIVTPKSIPDENSNRILIHLRGGGYVFNAGESGMGEAVLMAYYGKIKVISVDYRMARRIFLFRRLLRTLSLFTRKFWKPINQ
jgi:monoterpene epsilon-lactone hydrolase